MKNYTVLVFLCEWDNKSNYVTKLRTKCVFLISSIMKYTWIPKRIFVLCPPSLNINLFIEDKNWKGAFCICIQKSISSYRVSCLEENFYVRVYFPRSNLTELASICYIMKDILPMKVEVVSVDVGQTCSWGFRAANFLRVISIVQKI